MNHARTLAGLAALLLVAACGGGSDGGDDDDAIVSSGDSSARDPSFVVGTSTAPLAFVGFAGDGTRVDDESLVNLATGSVTGGAFAGTLNAARTEIALAGGGTVVLTNPAATEYVRLFERDTGAFGVTGFLSDPADLPGSGRVSYTGAAAVVAADATRLYDLDGTATVVADFGAGRVSVELGNLRGTAQGISPGNTGTVTIPSGGAIAVEGSRISGATFAGGTATASGLPFSLTAGANASGTSGGFFGPGADEAAGRVVVDDSAGDVGILGTFVAE